MDKNLCSIQSRVNNAWLVGCRLASLQGLRDFNLKCQLDNLITSIQSRKHQLRPWTKSVWPLRIPLPNPNPNPNLNLTRNRHFIFIFALFVCHLSSPRQRWLHKIYLYRNGLAMILGKLHLASNLVRLRQQMRLQRRPKSFECLCPMRQDSQASILHSFRWSGALSLYKSICKIWS